MNKWVQLRFHNKNNYIKLMKKLFKHKNKGFSRLQTNFGKSKNLQYIKKNKEMISFQ